MRAQPSGYAEFCQRFLRYPDGPNAGDPFEPLDWQVGFADEIFQRDEDGNRTKTHGYLSAARGTGKTTYMASILLYLLCSRSEERAPQLLTSATQREQARLTFDKAARMVEISPVLRDRVKVAANEITYKGGSIRALSRDAKAPLGLSPSCVIFDESAFLSDRRHYDSLVSGAFKRPNALVIHITTSGNDQSVWGYALDRTYREIHEGKIINPRVVTRFYQADPGCDPLDEKQWYKANPSLGVTVRVEDVRHQAQEAMQSNASMHRFRTFQLNQWTSPEETFLNLDEWFACNQPLPDLKGRECYAGLDLSSSRDFTSFVLLFPPVEEGEPHWVLPYFWLPEATLAERDAHTLQPYMQWAKDGYLLTTPGNVIDLDFIRSTIEEAAETYRILDIGYDPYASNQLVPSLHGKGIPLTAVRQGARTLGQPMKELDAMVASRRLASDHPILDYNITVLRARYDGNGNPTPDRLDHTRKIDGAAALINAIERMLYAKASNEEEPKLMTADELLLW